MIIIPTPQAPCQSPHLKQGAVAACSVITGNVDFIQIELVGHHVDCRLVVLRGGDGDLVGPDDEFVPEWREREGGGGGGGEVLNHQAGIECLPLQPPVVRGESHLGSTQSGLLCLIITRLKSGLTVF